ncbi:hypothetical protein, partial [Specibacter cremeus]|uniref:hypothetical protein n=1 Tax=Specibacter cremeus TaxID=1629051 RepID=UPI00197B9C68
QNQDPGKPRNPRHGGDFTRHPPRNFGLKAHIVSADGAPVYSHSSAARINGLEVWGCGSKVHVTNPFTTNGRSNSAEVIAHTQPLAAEDVLVVEFAGRFITVTSIEQTVLDCARLFGVPRAVVTGDHALHLGVDVDSMRRMLTESPVRRGSARARVLLDALDARSESAGESRTRWLMTSMRLPMPDLQVEIPTPLGLFRADFAWREFMLILEFDGDKKYLGTQPTAEVLLAERKRENALVELGWQFLRIEWKDLADPARLEARIRAALVRAGAALDGRGQLLSA